MKRLALAYSIGASLGLVVGWTLGEVFRTAWDWR